MSQSISYALWGLSFGILLSVPVGPVNIICLRRALFGRSFDAFLLGLGAALGDAFYAALAAFGMHAVFQLIEAHDTSLKLIGGCIMIVFAWRIWTSHPHLSESPETGELVKGMAGTFLMTVTNPGVFLGFVGLYGLAGIGSLTEADGLHAGATPLVAGVFVGAGLWWGLLALLTKSFRDKINDRLLEILNHISASLIGLFALITLLSALIL
ncbi:LysE family translocator [Kordiimonas pumila]|uniref:LysE family translocator n=1 Tax=Kordiimonas pumila TaxID=2161677 RepID=A0ABV7D7U3_9PROT|nr:LysE family transporter [Kordiimonas pumila]